MKRSSKKGPKDNDITATFTKEVQLHNVTREEFEAASAVFGALLDKYKMTGDDRDVLWKSACFQLTYALIDKGRMSL